MIPTQLHAWKVVYAADVANVLIATLTPQNFAEGPRAAFRELHMKLKSTGQPTERLSSQ